MKFPPRKYNIGLILVSGSPLTQIMDVMATALNYLVMFDEFTVNGIVFFACFRPFSSQWIIIQIWYLILNETLLFGEMTIGGEQLLTPGVYLASLS